MVNRIEWVRRQLYDLQAVLTDRGGVDEVIGEANALDESLIAVEDNLIRLLTAGSDGVRWAPKLAEELRYLSGNISGSDFRPTDQAGEVQRILHERVVRYRGEVTRLLDDDVAAFNRRLLDRNLAPLISDM